MEVKFIRKDTNKMEEGIRLFLTGLGVPLDDQHTAETPKRVAKAWTDTFAAGYDVDVEQLLSVQFSDSYSQMIVVKDIPFCSTCAHHLVPFIGKAKVGYIPAGKVTGLSKLARLVDTFSQRLQIQERLTDQIAHTLYRILQPKGVGVILEAEHLCMTQRGIRKPGSITVTSSLLGCILESEISRQEFLSF
jgi:GTP cyclohydrolase I